MSTLVFVHLFNDRSGSPKVLSHIVRAMYQRGAATEVLTSSHANGFLSDLPGIRRDIFYRRSENKVVTLFYYLLSQAYLFMFCLRYWRQDVVFYVNTMMPFGASLSAYLMGKPVVYHVHETSLRPALLKRFLRQVINLTARKIVFVSNYLGQAEGFSGKNQYVVHNALDDVVTQRCVRHSDEAFNVLMVCSLKAYKGVPEFFDIAGKLLDRPDVRFTLVLNAEPGEIDALLSGMSIPANVTLFPRQADVTRFYEQAHLLLNLSRPDEWVETFGLTILEGMAQGLPVVVPPVGGPAEIVSDGREGFLISCYETQRIAELIGKLALDSELHLHLATNAQARAKDFSLATFEEKIAAVIES